MLALVTSWFTSKHVLEGAAIISTRTAYFVDIYEETELTEGNGWYFSWRTEDHSRGSCEGPFLNRDMADLAKDRQAKKWGTDVILVGA